MPFCIKCGAKYETGETFCSKCGASLSDASSAANSSNNLSAVNSSEKSFEVNNGLVKICTFVFFIIQVPLAVFNMAYYNKLDAIFNEYYTRKYFFLIIAIVSCMLIIAYFRLFKRTVRNVYAKIENSKFIYNQWRIYTNNLISIDYKNIIDVSLSDAPSFRVLKIRYKAFDGAGELSKLTVFVNQADECMKMIQEKMRSIQQ